MSVTVTDADRAAWLGLPFRHHGICSKCKSAVIVAGRRRSTMTCVECASATRHRRLGQLRRRV